MFAAHHETAFDILRCKVKLTPDDKCPGQEQSRCPGVCMCNVTMF